MEWNDNNIIEIVNYINEELKKGRSQKDIEVNDFGVAERVIAKRLKRKGYKKVDNQWIYANDNSHTSATTDIKPVEKKDPVNELSIFNDDKMKNNLIDLVKNYDKIMTIVNQYDKVSDSPSYMANNEHFSGISIELPIDPKKDYRTTVRVNSVVWDQFTAFTDSHKEFTKKDLLSMALKEYINKYKKE